MVTLERHIESKAKALLDLFPVLLIIGPRQVGKTTLARKIRPDWRYFDLEKESDFEFITRDFDFFFRENTQHIIIDEAQESPALFRELRGVIDADRQQKNRFILTGSSSPLLLNNIADSLAGRVAILELGTCKCSELFQTGISDFYSIFEDKITRKIKPFLKTIAPKLSSSQIKNAFLKGGYPEPMLFDNPQFYQPWMANYIDTYINRDIRKLFPKLDNLRYRRFIRMISGISGSLINRSELGRSLDCSEKTVRDYLEIAEHSFIWRNIYSFEKTSKALVKKPKGIFRDSGINHYLNQIHHFDDLHHHRDVGINFEAFVIEEIIKGLEASHISNWQPSYFRTQNGSEVDLILEGPFGVIPIEIKYGISTSLKQLRPLTEFIKSHDCELGFVINHSTTVRALSDCIIQIPVGLL